MDEGDCSVIGQRARYHTQLAKLVAAGASELVDVQGKAELLVKNAPKSLTESRRLIFGKSIATEHRSLTANVYHPPVRKTGFYVP